MALNLPTRGDVDRYRRRYSLEGVTFTLAFAWRQRTASWYVDVLAADGSPILQGQRVSASSPLWPDPSAPGLPPGVVVVVGPDTYLRGQLGTDLRLVYLTAAEVAGG